jgi:hypothetical protein
MAVKDEDDVGLESVEHLAAQVVQARVEGALLAVVELATKFIW